jgi:hypothetical protein
VKKRILTLAITLALLATMLVPMAALALDPNQSGQSASTFTGTIGIVAKNTAEAVDVIAFPPAPPNTTVSNPVNFTDWDPAVDPPPPPANWAQALSPTDSSPVVRLKNTTGGPLIVWFQVSDWGGTPRIVTEERYELVDTGTLTVNAVTDVLSPGGAAYTVCTFVTIAATGDPGDGDYKDLYLEVDLCDTAGVTGGSLLTVLGSAP